MKASTAIHAIGRRKSSIARVFVKTGSGVITVNGREFEEYFDRPSLRLVVKQPLTLLSIVDKYDIAINLCGGGPSGQAGAALPGEQAVVVVVEQHVGQAERAVVELDRAELPPPRRP